MLLNIKRLTMEEARKKIAAIDSLDDVAFSDLVKHWTVYDVGEGTFDSSYSDFRKELIECFKSALIETGGKMSYLLDLRMGIKLYELINPQNGFTIVQANDDDIWRYISVCVMPDITYLRYPKPEQGSIRINQKRFYSHTRRIWLKTLWWYIHLSWQGSSDKTFDVLKNNGTNIISHFIERPGKGYRPELFRNIMYVYSTLTTQKDEIFRAAAKLNLAKCITVEPGLTIGGERGYSTRLFNEILQEGTLINAN
jgi:hypothetical protein